MPNVHTGKGSGEHEFLDRIVNNIAKFSSEYDAAKRDGERLPKWARKTEDVQEEPQIASPADTDNRSLVEQVKARRAADRAQKKAREDRFKAEWRDSDRGEAIKRAVSTAMAEEGMRPSPGNPRVRALLPEKSERTQSERDFADRFGFSPEDISQSDNVENKLEDKNTTRRKAAAKALRDFETTQKKRQFKRKGKQQATKKTGKRAVQGFTKSAQTGQAVSQKTQPKISRQSFLETFTRKQAEIKNKQRTSKPVKGKSYRLKGIKNKAEQAEAIPLPPVRERPFRIPDRILKSKLTDYERDLLGIKNKKLTDDQKIQAAIVLGSYDSMFPNAVNLERDRMDMAKMREEEKAAEDTGAEMTPIDDFAAGYGRQQEDAVLEQRRFLDQTFIPTEGMWIDDDGYIRMDPDLEERVVEYMRRWNLKSSELWLVFHMVSKEIGYAPDNHALYLRKKKNKVPKWLFVKALENMDFSMKMKGHPYYMVDRNLSYGNTRCYPIGMMTRVEAEILCRDGGPCAGKDVYQLVSDARNYFVGEVLPDMRYEAHQSDEGMKQLLALENYVRALCSLDSISSDYFHVSSTLDRGYEILLRDADSDKYPDKDDKEVQDLRRKQFEQLERRRNRAQKMIDKRRNRTKAFYTTDIVDEDTGEVIHRRGDRVVMDDYWKDSPVTEIRASRIDGFNNFCAMAALIPKIMGVIGYLPVLAGAQLEHAVGNIYAWESNRLIGNIGMIEDKEDYAVTEMMRAYMSTPEAIEAVQVMKVLERIGGMEAVAIFWSRYGEKNGGLTKANAEKFLKEDVNQIGMFSGSEVNVIKKVANRANEALNMLMPGDLGWGRQDAQRFIEALMINNAIVHTGGDVRERSFTSAEIQEMMQSMGMARFIGAMTDTVSGRDAFLMTRNQTLSRESPLAHATDLMLRRCGLADLIITFGIDTYFRYGIGLMETMAPFSNTISYLVVKGANVVYRGIQGIDSAEGSDIQDLNILNYQMGGNDGFMQGLRKNLCYDFVKIGNVGMFGCFLALVLMAIGFDPPEGKEMSASWDEYLIGGRIGLGPDGKGIPIYRAWFLDDITQIGLPLAYGICIFALDPEHNQQLAVNCFRSGCLDVVGGAGPFDLVRAITAAPEIVTEYEKLMNDPDPDALRPSSLLSYVSLELIELPFARAANKTVPNVGKNLLIEEYNHDPYKVYDRSSFVPGATEPVGTWEELERRKETEHNVLYAYYLNLTQNHYLTDDGTTTKTGYLANEMPLKSHKDPKRLQFAEDNIRYDESMTPEEVDAECERFINEVVGKYDSIDAALADGYWVYYPFMIECKKYCLERRNAAWNYYYMNKQNYYGQHREEMYQQAEARADYYTSLIDNWFNPYNVPWTDEGYVELNTNYTAVYYRKDGTPATRFEYAWEGPENIEKRWISRGDRKQSVLEMVTHPFASPETAGKGWNFETISNWYDEDLTDLESVFQSGFNEDGTPRLVQTGNRAGTPINNVLFGGDVRFAPDGQAIVSDEYGAEEPVVGERNWVPYVDEMLLNAPNLTFGGNRLSSSNESNGSSSSNESNGSSSSNESNGSSASSTSADASGGNGNGNDAGKTPASSKVSGDTDLSWNLDPGKAFEAYDSITYKNVDGGILGEMGQYHDKDYWLENSKLNDSSYGYGTYPSYRGGGGGSSSYTPRIYSSSRSINGDRATTMYTKTLQDARVTSYLHPGVTTKGSREAYKRQD